MTDSWKSWTSQYDGHAPDDWDGGDREYFTDFKGWMPVRTSKEKWFQLKYRYRSTQDATHEPNNASYGKMMADLTEQCLMLPQADRDALIEALQKPQRDWADDVWNRALNKWAEKEGCSQEAAAVIRSMCRPKEEN